MAAAATTTTWEIKLKETVLGTMNKIRDAFGGTQNRLRSMNSGMEQMRQVTNNTGRDFQRNYRQLDDLLRGLQRRQHEAFNTRDIQAYQRMIDRTRAEMARLNAVTQPQRSRWQRFTGGISEAAGQIPGMGSLMSFATNPYTIAAGAVLAIGTATTKLALDYQTGMAKINATAQLPTETLDKLKDRLKEIGSASGGNFELIPDAYEKILSQTGKVNMSLNILETAVKGSKAGFTDIDTVAGALAKTMSIVGENNVTADEVMDTLLKAKAVGAGEFTDFANYMPGLIAAGKNLNITWQDTAGIFAYMTTKTRDAADATMLIKNAYTALSKSDIRKGLASAGIKLFNPKGEFRRMDEIFKDLETKFGAVSTKSKLNLLESMGLKDAQAKEAFAILMGDAKKLKESIDGVNHSLGETENQLKATANVSRTWADIGDELKSWGETLGEYIIPILDALIQGINGFAHGLKDLFTGEMFVDREAMNAAKHTSQSNAAAEAARNAANKKFGMWSESENPSLTKARNDFMVKHNDDLLKAMRSSKNSIDPNEKSGGSKVDAANTGNSKYSGSAKSEPDSVLTGKGEGSGGRSLTQNLYITINIKKASDIDDGKLKRKITDTVVDAGRDGLVTIGA